MVITTKNQYLENNHMEIMLNHNIIALEEEKSSVEALNFLFHLSYENKRRVITKKKKNGD